MINEINFKKELIDWREVSIELFEETVVLKKEIKKLELLNEYWQKEALMKVSENADINQGEVACDIELY